MLKIAKLAGAAALALAASFGAHATTVNLTSADFGQWKSFDAFDTALPAGFIDIAYEGDFTPLSFRFTLASDAYLNVVDSGFAGDRFEIFDNGNSIGMTSTPTNTYDSFSWGVSQGHLSAAFADARFSSGTYLLTAGNHEITGTLVSSTAPLEFQYATTGAIMLTPVPEPETYGMLLAGLALIGAIARRRA
jgi:hypothetical protein